MNRRSLWLLTVLLLASTHLAQAQQPRKLSRIGFLGSGSFSTQKPLLDILSQSLRELGYIEGQNIVIESRFAEGKDERYADLAAELVRLRPDVIVTVSTTATFAARQASSTIPIVAGSAGDLVGAGLVASIARPGGNVTGSTNIDPDLGAKRLELLREFFPKLSRVAVLYHGGLGGDDEELKEMQDRARTFKIQVQPLEVKDPSQFSATYAAMKRDSAAALIILRGGFTKFHLTELLELAAKNQLPTMCGEARWSDAGCLISYGPDVIHQWQRTAVFVDKILKGAKPAELPVEQPMKFNLVINLKTAKQIGLTISPNMMARANKVIK